MIDVKELVKFLDDRYEKLASTELDISRDYIEGCLSEIVVIRQFILMKE